MLYVRNKKETNHNFLPALSSSSSPSSSRFLLQAVLITPVPHSVLHCHFTQPEQMRKLNQSHFLPTTTAFIFCCFGCRHRLPCFPCETSRLQHWPPDSVDVCRWMGCSLAARFILPTAHGRWSLGRGRRGGEARWKLKIILLWHLINKCKCEARTGLEPLTKLPIKPWADGLALRPPSPKLYRLSVFPLNVWSASSRHLFVCAHTDLCAFVRISIPKAAGCALISLLRTLRKRKQTTATKKKKEKMQFVLCMRDKLLIFNWF